MTAKQLVSAIVAVSSVWMGGSVGAAALEKANAAPLAGAPAASGLSPSHAHARLARVGGSGPA